MGSGEAKTTVLLDTSIQIDRCKTANRKSTTEQIVAQFDRSISTAISLLEFKATILREMILIHNQKRLKGRFTAVCDALMEKKYRQLSLRVHIFHNLLSIQASSFTVTPEQDAELAEKARLLLENHIRQLYRWFRNKSVDSIYHDRSRCSRALEPPQKKRVAFARMPTCRRGENKDCRIEELIRENLWIVRELDRPNLSEQLSRALELFRRVEVDPDVDLSHQDCRRAGDCLIALEATDRATHVASTNADEWEILSAILGYQFVHVRYPDEKTK